MPSTRPAASRAWPRRRRHGREPSRVAPTFGTRPGVGAFQICWHYFFTVTRDLRKRIETLEIYRRTYPRNEIPAVNLAGDYAAMGEPETRLGALVRFHDPADRVTLASSSPASDRGRSAA